MKNYIMAVQRPDSLSEPQLFADGVAWPESPRWRGDALWISDVHNFRLLEVFLDGRILREIDIPQRPAGIDFVSDTELLVASALDRHLQIVNVHAVNPSPKIVADLSSFASSFLNDMVVHPNGCAYVGDTGFKFGVEDPVRNGKIIAFHRDHGPRVVAEEVFFPNGLVISPDGATLYVAETFGEVITAFDVADNGDLANRRTYITLPSAPDGLCMDAEGCLWVPLLHEGRFARANSNGNFVDEIRTPHENAISCVFGGRDRSTLFLGSATVEKAANGELTRRGGVYALQLPFPGAGRP